MTWAAALVALVFLLMNPLTIPQGGRGVPLFLAKPKSPPPTKSGTMPAKSLQEFRNGVCANVHWNFLDTPYNGSFTALKNALVDLHITCARAMWSPGESWHTTRLKDLAAVGIKHSLLIDDEFYDDSAEDRAAADADSSGHVSAAEALDYLMDVAPETVLQLEGPNEELFDSTQCAASLQNAQDVWAAKQADSRLADIPFIGPSAAQSTQYSCLGDISAITDAGNIHSYPGGLSPEATTAGSSSLQSWMQNARAVVGEQAPVVATETGYHTAINYGGGHSPVSETADGKYTSQLNFAYQRAGVQRAFKYELVDEFNNPALDDLQSNFGLLRNDLSQKPAYVSLNNVMDLLADDTQATLIPLDYSVSGAPATFKQYLLQKSDGTHWLAMWNDISVWNGTTDLTPSDVNVTLTLGTAKTIKTYRPYTSASAASTTTGTSASVPINADVTLVEIR